MSDKGNGNIHYHIEAHGNLDWAHWADGPFCPHCGEREAIRMIHGQTSRPGIYHCLTCRKRFAGTLDILFQNATTPAAKRLPGMTVVREIWGVRRHPLFRIATFPLWYLRHIIRQIIMGSDPRPPTKP